MLTEITFEIMKYFKFFNDIFMVIFKSQLNRSNIHYIYVRATLSSASTQVGPLNLYIVYHRVLSVTTFLLATQVLT